MDANIETVRTEPVIPIWKEKLFEERELYAAKVNKIDTTKVDKRYIKVKHLSQSIYKWCYVTGSVHRDFLESKISVGDVVLVGYVKDHNAPIVIDRVIV